MHCLGAVTGGSPSPNGVGGRGGILSVFRALGVLVCEGRIQGPPRGYKEGPHCAPPMQAAPNGHVCDEDDYLCNRYLVLVREIADRTAIGSFLCVEVLLCSDCPCGLAKATCKHPVWPLPSLSISPWQHTSEMLLEYWCICVVSSKSPEMMNYQGLYQAVRSRLHFSQVAAWWSRSNGTAPSYIATRVVPYKDDNLRKFRETPMEHTFPLAGNGDGNSIKVTVWALPRMEEVPILTCPLHQSKEKDEEGVARALTPTKAIPVTTAPQANDGLVLPVLVDDRLQTPCNKPGKHHCSCEEDDGSPPSPSIPRPNGERKRRRSLPCGPADNCVAFQQIPLPSVQESTTQELNSSSSYPKSSSEMTNNRAGVFKSIQSKSPRFQDDKVRNRNNINSDNLERCFKTQLSIEESEGNVEKRYKRTVETSVCEKDEKTNNSCKKDNPEKINAAKPPEKNGLFDNLIPFNPSLPWSFVESWNNANSKCAFQSLRASKECHFNDLDRMYKTAFKDSSLAIDPFRQSSPFHESNPGPSTYNQLKSKQDTACTVHQSCSKVPVNKLVTSESISPGKDALECDNKDSTAKIRGKPKDLSQLMSKLAFPEEKDKNREEGGILEWFSKVPGKVLGVTPSTGYVDSKEKANLKSRENSNEVKLKNCNLELSQREFDEVLAVLRTRTPSGRRRASLKTVKRRDRSEKTVEDGSQGKLNLENAEFATNNIVNRAKSCDDCSHKLCKKNEHQVAGKLSCVNRSYCNKNIYNPAHQKQDKLASGIHGDLEKCNNDKSESLQSVSNKADILLGAILRTSKDRKGTCDTFNGTRPQCNLAREEKEPNPSTENGGDRTNLERVHYEDEKSLSVGLNKRFNRFRQLFKKEQERKMTTAGLQESLPSFALNALGFNNAQPHEVPRDSKAKRRIDFSNFEEKNDKYSVKEEEEEEEELSTNGAHQNSRIHSTNSKEDGRCENGMDREISAREDRSRLHSTKEGDNVDEGVEKGGKRECKEAARSEKSSFVYLQNGYASSKLRSNNNNNNNNKDGVSEEEDEAPDKSVPSAIEQERFRRSLENAASMVFHSRTGLPLTSSPAPLRRGSCCFDYDSSLNSVSSKRSALFELNTPPSPGAVSLEETDRETENAGEEAQRRRTATRSRPQSHALLGSFEESALNGRLEPVSTVHGFTAELGASGSFCPKHRKLPVTVFFYTLGDNDKVSTPYLAHINLGKKGYQVPRSGTIQVTLLNPLGTVVKMFVVMYDLSDMPARSHTFLRQRTLRDKTLRYLVHLRFMSGKTGRIYLHTDIRMIICRKSDVDTASDFGSEPPKELRSYVHGPTNPKFSPRC